MAQRPLWWLNLSEKTEFAPYLWKIKLVGDGLAQFPEAREGDYIKLLLPNSPAVSIHDVNDQTPDLSHFTKRSYTVCEFDKELQSLTIYITRHHAVPGPAARWANEVTLGDAVLITGPGPVEQIDVSARRFLLLGDLPSLGAVLANLRRLPQTAQGNLIFDAPEPLSLVEQSCPLGLKIHWVNSESQSSAQGSPMLLALKKLDIPTAGCAVWAACEYSNMKLLREYFISVLGLMKSQYYLTSYYKLDATDEQHKKTRKDEGYKE